ncbi:unnamed protein product [Vitrella brassicaformis CCMP3155]|uniref:RING-type domain-containing protein n=1 Tax=Vitrella brassicaformis (strain CCMP3155) TaxID=1169540 RepID=A0A0G4FIY6_VITBC|nr:unnamed protein product [Vitrella brassicaformis CCMP3155]|eukprot:CEM13070.1 unnamed protein product [Vitrella brassicaformis CCMP3155]
MDSDADLSGAVEDMGRSFLQTIHRLRQEFGLSRLAMEEYMTSALQPPNTSPPPLPSAATSPLAASFLKQPPDDFSLLRIHSLDKDGASYPDTSVVLEPYIESILRGVRHKMRQEQGEAAIGREPLPSPTSFHRLVARDMGQQATGPAIAKKQSQRKRQRDLSPLVPSEGTFLITTSIAGIAGSDEESRSAKTAEWIGEIKKGSKRVVLRPTNVPKGLKGSKKHLVDHRETRDLPVISVKRARRATMDSSELKKLKEKRSQAQAEAKERETSAASGLSGFGSDQASHRITMLGHLLPPSPKHPSAPLLPSPSPSPTVAPLAPPSIGPEAALSTGFTELEWQEPSMGADVKSKDSKAMKGGLRKGFVARLRRASDEGGGLLLATPAISAVSSEPGREESSMPTTPQPAIMVTPPETPQRPPEMLGRQPVMKKEPSGPLGYVRPSEVPLGIDLFPSALQPTFPPPPPPPPPPLSKKKPDLPPILSGQPAPMKTLEAATPLPSPAERTAGKRKPSLRESLYGQVKLIPMDAVKQPAMQRQETTRLMQTQLSDGRIVTMMQQPKTATAAAESPQGEKSSFFLSQRTELRVRPPSSWSRVGTHSQGRDSSVQSEQEDDDGWIERVDQLGESFMGEFLRKAREGQEEVSPSRRELNIQRELEQLEKKLAEKYREQMLRMQARVREASEARTKVYSLQSINRALRLANTRLAAQLDELKMKYAVTGGALDVLSRDERMKILKRKATLDAVKAKAREREKAAKKEFKGWAGLIGERPEPKALPLPEVRRKRRPPKQAKKEPPPAARKAPPAAVRKPPPERPALPEASAEPVPLPVAEPVEAPPVSLTERATSMTPRQLERSTSMTPSPMERMEEQIEPEEVEPDEVAAVPASAADVTPPPTAPSRQDEPPVDLKAAGVQTDEDYHIPPPPSEANVPSREPSARSRPAWPAAKEKKDRDKEKDKIRTPETKDEVETPTPAEAPATPAPAAALAPTAKAIGRKRQKTPQKGKGLAGPTKEQLEAELRARDAEDVRRAMELKEREEREARMTEELAVASREREEHEMRVAALEGRITALQREAVIAKREYDKQERKLFDTRQDLKKTHADLTSAKKAHVSMESQLAIAVNEWSSLRKLQMVMQDRINQLQSWANARDAEAAVSNIAYSAAIRDWQDALRELHEDVKVLCDGFEGESVHLRRHLLCPACEKPMRMPYTLQPCGHTICIDCLRPLLSADGQEIGRPVLCMVCQKQGRTGEEEPSDVEPVVEILPSIGLPNRALEGLLRHLDELEEAERVVKRQSRSINKQVAETKLHMNRLNQCACTIQQFYRRYRAGETLQPRMLIVVKDYLALKKRRDEYWRRDSGMLGQGRMASIATGFDDK